MTIRIVIYTQPCLFSVDVRASLTIQIVDLSQDAFFMGLS